MSTRRSVADAARRTLQRGLARFGAHLIRRNELDALVQAGGPLGMPASAATPADVGTSLRPDHPRPAVRILDIGAGYGRLAHRLVQAMPDLERMYCADAVAESTFISEYYLRYRGVDDRAVVLPLDDVCTAIDDGEVDVACNVHSFSECPLDAIEWWLALLARKRVRHLFIVPNSGDQLTTREADGGSLDFTPALRRYGYELIVREPKYRLSPGVQRHGVYPTYYHLFELAPTRGAQIPLTV